MLRSVDRTLGTPSSFSINLPKTYSNIVSMSLVSAEIPYSFPNISESYAFNVHFTQVAPTTITADYTVPAGQYTINDIQAHLLAFLQASFPVLAISAVNYSSITGLISIIIGNNSGALAVSKGNTVTPALCAVLGVDYTTTVNSVYANGVNALTFTNAANLQPQSSLMLKIQNLPTNISSTTGALGLFRVQVSSPPGSIIFINNANNVSNTVNFTTPVTVLNSMIVQVANADNTQTNFRGAEWTMSLKITCAVV